MRLILLFLFINTVFASNFENKLAELLNNDVKLTQEREYIEYYNALKLAGYSRFLPRFSINSVQTKQTADTGFDLKQQRNSADLSIDLFRFGEDYFLAKEAQKLNQAQQQRYQAQLLNSQKILSELLFNYIEKSKAISIREEIIKLKSRAYSIAKNRYDAGKLSLQDFHKVEIDLNNTQAALENELIQFNRLLNSLASYGKVDDLIIEWPWNLKIEKIEKISVDIYNVQKHPAYKLEELALESLKLRKKSTISSMFGSLTLTYSKGEVQNLETNEEYMDESLMLSFNIPLFNNFNHYASYKKAVTDEYVGAAQFQNSKRFLASSFEASSANLKSSLRTFKLRNKTLKLSQELFQHTLRQFQNGRISVNDLILDQDRLLQTKLLANSGAETLHLAIVNFCTSIGKNIQSGCIE